MASTAEGAIAGAALPGWGRGSSRREAWLPAPRALGLGKFTAGLSWEGRGEEEMRMDQGLDFWFLDNLRKRNNNNKTLQLRHSSACRGAFVSSCKMVGEGRENNDRSTYFTGSKPTKCIKGIQICFLKVSCSVKLFSFFWAQTQDFWVLPLGKTDSNSGRRQETWLFLAFLKNLFSLCF